MSRVRQRSPRNSVDGDDDMSTGSASPAPLLPSSTKDVTPSKEGFSLLKGALLAGVVVQNAALNVTARWSRVEALHREARGECHASPGAVVLVIELMKIVLALVLLAVEIKGNPVISVMKTTVTHPLDCLKVIVPAVLYVIQNQLLLVAARAEFRRLLRVRLVLRTLFCGTCRPWKLRLGAIGSVPQLPLPLLLTGVCRG